MNDTVVTYFEQFSGYTGAVEGLGSLLGADISGFVAFLVFLAACGAVVGVLSLVGASGPTPRGKYPPTSRCARAPTGSAPTASSNFGRRDQNDHQGGRPAGKGRQTPLYPRPLLALLGVLATLAVLPFSGALALSDLNVGIFYLIGVSSLVGVAVFLGGYASNSKWSMLGGMRGASQIISYEVPVTLSILAVVLLAGGLSFGTVVEAQGGMPNEWFLFHNPFTFVAFFVLFVGMLAETNRAPFDLPEAESELVSGYHTEYTGMRFAFFALAEYIEVFVVCGVAVALFLGGYKVPFGIGDGQLFVERFALPPFVGLGMGQLMQLASFLRSRRCSLYYVVIWIRWTLPRLRVDQLMTVCWKYLTPIALFNLVGVAVWVVVFDGRSLWEMAFGGGHV